MLESNERYTVDLLEKLTNDLDQYGFDPYLIIGSDIYEELSRWKEWDRIKELAEIVTIHRHGHEFECVSGDVVRFPDISSTDIRLRLREGRDVSNFLHKDVLEYIRKNNLEF